jgi:hypothetical protein
MPFESTDFTRADKERKSSQWRNVIAKSGMDTCLGLALLAGFALAQESPQVDDLVQALAPKFGVESGTFSVEDFQERIVNRIGVEEARKLPSQTKNVPRPIAPEFNSLPITSIAIRFDHKSSAVSDASFPAVLALGRALNHPSLVRLKS